MLLRALAGRGDHCYHRRMATEHETSRTLPLLAALTGGVLLAMALQILLSARGLQTSDLWRDMIAGNPLSLRAALVWWIIAGSALVAGAAIARPIAQFALPWRRNRTLRWIAGAAILFGLAHVGHGAAVPEGVTALVYLMVTTTAVVLAAVMATIGAVFALRA
jgi:hypothetical protein